MVGDDHSAVAVQNPASRRDDRHRFDAVCLRALIVNLRVLHLQAPEPRNQQQENDYGGVLKNSDLARRKIRIVAQRWFFRELLPVEIRIGWRQDHNFARGIALILYSSRWVLMRPVHSAR